MIQLDLLYKKWKAVWIELNNLRQAFLTRVAKLALVARIFPFMGRYGLISKDPTAEILESYVMLLHVVSEREKIKNWMVLFWVWI